jgi:putative MATE family efflux protein
VNFSKLFAPKDMTEGAPWKRIVEFSIPMLIGNIAQQLYNTADSIIVGKYVGDNALAAVGSSFPILMLLLVLFVGISTGASIMVSQYFGAKDREKLSKTIGISITLTAIASVIIMVVGPLVTRPLLSLLNTPDTIFDWSADYLIIFFLGIAGFSYYNILSGILRGLGDSLSPLVFLLVSTVLNVGLDIWFVAGLNMGVAGVALATIIAQGISSILCFIKLLKMKDTFDLNWKMLKLDKHYSKKLIRLGLPSGLTQGIFSLAMIAVQSLTNSFGEMVIAATVIIMRVDGFAMMPNFTFGMAMTTYAGQNIGARKIDRVEKGTKDGTLIAVGVSAVITILILIFGKYLMGIFTDTQELVDLSMHMMRILAVGYVAMAVMQCLSGVMRGAGDTMTPMWISLITTVALRVPVAYGIAYFTRSEAYPSGRPEATFISLLVAWTIGSVVTAIFYKKGAWRKKGLVDGDSTLKISHSDEDIEIELKQQKEA